MKLMATGIRERGERERDGERWTNRQRGREIDRQLDRDERLNGGEMTERRLWNHGLLELEGATVNVHEAPSPPCTDKETEAKKSVCQSHGHLVGRLS